MRILVVDDELSACERTCEAAREAFPDAEVRGVLSAAEALAIVGSRSFDVVLLDVEMPGMDGLELARVLRRDLPELRIVFVTAHREYAYDAFALHVDGYLLKPARAKDLRRELRTIGGGMASVRHRHQPRALARGPYSRAHPSNSPSRHLSPRSFACGRSGALR